MVRVYDADANALIEKTAGKLKKMGIKKPEFVGLVKSGAHTERPPQSEDFWYTRCASLLRQAYVNSNVGVQRMRRHYGGKKNRGVKPEKHVPAGGSTVRKAFQAMEEAGLMEKGPTGRKLTAKGMSLLDSAASELSG
ncbi:30S ribosomal protein S19e [Candidatus Micrarchaeota archaeon]|nr:30S ribosomal protein S19e [Candidatus Micrarchaeota archaeon]MBD3417693.1 30S ribosomal protein S19e [Candidatus Micrarchaeota archaeon]